MNTAEREARLLEIGRRVVQTSPADETEVLLADGRDFLTRFAGNQIHQNVGAEEVWAVVRVAAGRRLGVATASSFEPAAVGKPNSEAVPYAVPKNLRSTTGKGHSDARARTSQR